MFLGYETMIRGYSYNSFTAEEASGAGFDFNRLFGSKLAIANLELRFPLFGTLGIGKGFYGIFPVDVIAFYDAGVAWQGGSDAAKPSLLGGDLGLLRSFGFGLRVNVLGYLVAGVNYVRPLDRPNKDWHFEFSFWPGF
jgi:outer membrane protein assembly factor BamA